MDHALTMFGVIVIGIAIGILLRRRVSASAPPKPLPDLSPDLKAQLQFLINQNRQIEAVKLLRERMNMGLVEATEVIKRMSETGPIVS